MIQSKTEHLDERYASIDLWPAGDLAIGVMSVQLEAVRAVAPALPSLSSAIEALAGKLRGGGRMAYAGAGSSGLIAQMDALEMPGTFGIDLDRVPVILAGGPGALHAMPGGAEDDGAAGQAAVDDLGLGAADGLVAVAASGATPFTVAAQRRARERGVLTVGIACVANSPLLADADIPVLLETPPEIIAGSTRMGAGTAQKCALNILSTGVAVRLGHVYAGLMVNMRPDNAKLKIRAASIVARAAGVEAGRAEEALVAADWSIKTAIVSCAAGIDAAAAERRLAETGGDVRAALNQESAAGGSPLAFRHGVPQQRRQG